MSGEWGSPTTVTGLTAYVVQLLTSICGFKPHILASRDDTLRNNFDMITRMRLVDLQSDVTTLRTRWHVDLSSFADNPETLLNAFLGWLHANCKDPCALLADELHQQQQKIGSIVQAFRIDPKFAGLWTRKRGDARRVDEVRISSESEKHQRDNRSNQDRDRHSHHSRSQRVGGDDALRYNAVVALADEARDLSKTRVSKANIADATPAAPVTVHADGLALKASLPKARSIVSVHPAFEFIGEPPQQDGALVHVSTASSSSSSSSAASRKPADAVVVAAADGPQQQTPDEPKHYDVLTQTKDSPFRVLRSVSRADVSVGKPSEPAHVSLPADDTNHSVSRRARKIRPVATWGPQSMFEESTQGVIPDLPSKRTEVRLHQRDQSSAQRPILHQRDQSSAQRPILQQSAQMPPMNNAPAAQQPQQPAVMSRASIREQSNDTSDSSHIPKFSANAQQRHNDKRRQKSRANVRDDATTSSGPNSSEDSG